MEEVLFERFPSQDFNTLNDAGNDVVRGIWSDDETMWVADYADLKLYAYALSTKARDSDKDIDVSANFISGIGGSGPYGISSYDTTMWVVDFLNSTLLAYKLTPGADFGARDSAKDIALVSDNYDPKGIWSDGETMWVAGLRSGENLRLQHLGYINSGSASSGSADMKRHHDGGEWNPFRAGRLGRRRLLRKRCPH